MGSSKITTKDLSEPVVEALNTIDTVADQITTVDSNVNSIKSTVEGNSGKLDTINTNSTNLNSRLTDTRASNLDLLSNSTYGLSALKVLIDSVKSSMSSGSSSCIKSIQSGTIKFSSSMDESNYGSKSKTATITSVDTTKAFIINRGYVVTDGGVDGVAVTLSSATKVTANIYGTTTSSNTVTIYFTVVEFM